MTFLDAHNHLHDRRLDPFRGEINGALAGLPLRRAVVNGTREEDWEAVAALAQEAPDTFQPSFGLHPWYVRERSAEWQPVLETYLRRFPGAGVGEIGLDRWVRDYDLPAQREVFAAQLALATRQERPATIHCLQAWGLLLEMLSAQSLPRCGFLLHSYGGPAEMVPSFAKLGAYFSFSPYFLHQRKGAARAVFQQIPLERLLVETDAPDMAPPPERNRHPLTGVDGGTLNHPANLVLAYEGLAALRSLPMQELSAVVAGNFERLFGAIPVRPA